MAEYDYSAYDPQVGQSDYPTKISGLITQLGLDITTESNEQDTIKVKTDFISVTQAVNLDTMETDIATNTSDIITINNTVANNVLLGNDNGAGQDFQELTATEAITILNGGSGLTLSTTGSAATLTTARNINGVAFDGSANISVPVNIGGLDPTDTTMYPVIVPNAATGDQTAYVDSGLGYNSSTNELIPTDVRFQRYSENADVFTVGTSITINCQSATYFYASGSMSGVAIEFFFTNPASSGRVTSITLELNNAAGATSITWPTTVDWPGATVPTWTSGIDLVSFITRDGGTTWLGIPSGFNFG